MLIKRLVLGLIDGLPFFSTLRQNIQSPQGGQGNLDVVRLLGSLISIGALTFAFYQIVKGIWSIEQAKEFINLFSPITPQY